MHKILKFYKRTQNYISWHPKVRLTAVIIQTLGIHYYDDDNWITRVPKGVLDIHSDQVQAALRRGRRPSLNGHLSLERSSSDPSTSSNKKSPVDSLKTFERTASDPLVAAEVLENRLLAQCHVNKAYQNTDEDLVNDNTKMYSKKGSPVKKSKRTGKSYQENHSSIDKSISTQSKVSRDSRTDSGFDSGEQWAKKKGLTPKSGTWTAKPKDIVSMMQPEDTLVKPDSSPKSNPATPNTNRSRRKERKRRDRAKRGEKSKAGIWSRGKMWAKRHVLDKHIDDDALSSAGYSESEFESSANSKCKSISQLAEQRQNPRVDKNKSGPKGWDDIDLESSYIDPSTIMSVPKMTFRLQHLQEHKDDAFEKPSGVMTTAFVHRKDREDEKLETYTGSAQNNLARTAAIRRGQYPESTGNEIADVKISNLEASNYRASYQPQENRSHQIDDDFGFDEDYIDDELVEWDDETVTMVDSTLPQKSFESYRQAYLDKVIGETSLTPTIATGIQTLPYDVLSEMYLNEEIAAEKAAEEEKRKLKVQPPLQLSTQETPSRSSTAASNGPGNKHTYLSLLNYAEDEETNCEICGTDHYPICTDLPDDQANEAPTPPPRPDLIEDNVRDDIPHSTAPSLVPKSKRETKPGTPSSSKQSIESTTSVPKSPIHNNISTPIQVSIDEGTEPPVYVNLDEVHARSNHDNKTMANPPPLPQRQGSLPRQSRNTPSEWRSKSMRVSYNPVGRVSESELLRSDKIVPKGVSPLIKRKIQKFAETSEEFNNVDDLDSKLATPVKNQKLISQQTLTGHKDSPVRVHPVSQLVKVDTIKRDGCANVDENKPEDDNKLLRATIDIKIQPATPIHKPSRLQMNENADSGRPDNIEGNDYSSTITDSDDKEGTLERIGSVAERRKLFERPIVKGHERGSARSFQPQITKGPDRASTRSMDYQMKGRSGLSLSLHDSPGILREQETDIHPKILGMADNDGTCYSNENVAHGVLFDNLPISKRVAMFEMTNKSDLEVKTSPSPSIIQKDAKAEAPGENTSNVQPVSVTVVKETKKSSVAKENKYEAGWKLHPDKLKIPEIFK